ncbi:MAG: DNA topoisomerase (ATP-hydrolyzing) subunit A [Turicibacter sp.]|nr:DNA topoisomerase (ATP-hydrolyzing) subunit A [Turicibacter sp.]
MNKITKTIKTTETPAIRQPAKESPITRQPVPEALELNYMPYAMSVIISRAIPEIDGFKPSHRKLLYTMYKMGLLTGGRIKSADVVGQTMRLNPHGDAAIYETLVRLTRGHAALLHPFVDSKGNFGKQYSRDMAFAASRYTEVKLDSICNEIFSNIDKDSVDMVDNYNSTTLEPVLLPTTFPNLLTTPNQGIAVGMASSVCSFNLVEICNTCAKWIINPNLDIMKGILAPDFASGAQIIYKREELEAIYQTGRGSFKLRAKYRIERDRKNNICIEVYEIPYTTTIEAIIDKVVALVKSGKLKDIVDIRDETDLRGLKIAIDIKKSADPDRIMRRLFDLTTLQDTFSCNFNFLIASRPRTMGIIEIFTEWLAFRMECLKRRLRHDIDRLEKQILLLEGLAKIAKIPANIDRAIKIIRQTELEDLVVSNLAEAFEIAESQAEYIAEIRLRNLNSQYLQKKVAELDDLQQQLDDLKKLLDDDDELRNFIAKELKAVAKKYGSPRRTEIIEEEQFFEEKEEIPDYPIKLIVTEQGYFKKIANLRQPTEQNVKEGDRILQELETSNIADILFFSNRYAVYKVRANDFGDSKAAVLGDYLPNLLEMDESEEICYIHATLDYSGFMLFAYENGKLAKVPLSSYEIRRKKILKAYSEKFNLVGMAYIPNDCDIFLIRGNDKALVFNTAILTPIATRNSNGVQVFTLRQNTLLTTFKPLFQPEEETEKYRIQKIPSVGRTLQIEL